MGLDGLSWRETLFPIPSVPTSMQLCAWQPVAKMPPDQWEIPGAHRQLGITNEHTFQTFI